MKKTAITFCIWIAVLGAQTTDLVKLGNSFRIYPSNMHQTEPFIVSNPNEPLHLFASANTTQLTPFFISEGVYVSTDRGISWRGNDTCTGANITFHGGDPGIAIDDSGRYVLVRIGRAPVYGLYSHTSTDKGISWSVQKQISNHDLERATVVSDNSPQSPYYGRIYASWVRFAPPFPVYISYTDDGGLNWTAPLQVNNPPQRCAGPDIAIKKDGTVYIAWAGVTNFSPFQETILGFGKSNDGGINWSVTESAFAVNGITGVLANKSNIRVNGYPRIAVDNSSGLYGGRIYIITTQKNNAPAGSDPDLILHRSSDEGSSWFAPLRMHGDALNNGKTQYFPALDIDDNGGINVLWYDDRSTTTDSVEVYIGRSINGGDTFSEMELSEQAFKPEPIGSLGQGYQGDNIALLSSGNQLIPLWMENSSGKYQLRTAPVQIVSSSVKNDNGNASDFTLYQNYPNPFNPETNIGFRLERSSDVSLNIYSQTGELMIELFSGMLGAGNHSLRFDAGYYNLSSGVYMYSLKTSGMRITKGMIFIK